MKYICCASEILIGGIFIFERYTNEIRSGAYGAGECRGRKT